MPNPPIRIPLAVPYQNREAATAPPIGSLLTDTYLQNCYIETQPDGRKLVVKRPALISAFTYNGGGATNGQGAEYYKGCVYAIGSNVLYRLSGSGNGSATGAAWTASTSAPWAGRSNFGCVIFNGLIFVMGGHNAGGLTQLNDVWSSPDGINWTQVTAAAPWTKRIDMGLLVLGNTLYLLGGTGASSDFNDVWSTTDGVNWTQLVGAAPWAARDGGGYTVFNGALWVLGGYSTASTTYLNDVWSSPDGVTWTQMVSVATWGIRAWAGVISQNGWIVVAGGYNGARLLDIWISKDGITWAAPQNLPAARSHMAVVAYAGLVWFIGGYDAAATRTTTVWSWPVTAAVPTVVTAAFGGTAFQGGSAVVLRTPTSINAFNSVTMWLLGGDTGAFVNTIFRATLNVALPASFAIATAAATTDQYQIETQNAGDYLILKNTSDAWVLYYGALTKITSTNYPTSTVGGVATVDDTTYVMDANGVIYGSDLSNPFGWSSLNFITADYVADTGVCITKYKNLVFALKSTSCQFFYDAGRYPGSPLLPAIQYNMKIGCISADFVVNMMDTVVWIARTAKGTPYVAVLDGMTVKKISTPAVDRILLQWGGGGAYDNAFGTRLNGHYVYVFIFSVNNISMAYDFDEDTWWIIQSGSSSLNSSRAFSDGINYYAQSLKNGILYKWQSVQYQDDGPVNITVAIQTEKVDGGSNKRKFASSASVIGDRRALTTNNLLIQWSDDDAQTFNTGQTVDLTKARPKVNRSGSFYRRQYRLTHTSNNPLRLEAIEVQV